MFAWTISWHFDQPRNVLKLTATDDSPQGSAASVQKQHEGEALISQ